jgi:hypothetical protein
VNSEQCPFGVRMTRRSRCASSMLLRRLHVSQQAAL